MFKNLWTRTCHSLIIGRIICMYKQIHYFTCRQMEQFITANRFLLRLRPLLWYNLLKLLNRGQTFPRSVYSFTSSTAYCLLMDFYTGLLEVLRYSETSNSSSSYSRQTTSSAHYIPGFMVGNCIIYVIVTILWNQNMQSTQWFSTHFLLFYPHTWNISNRTVLLPQCHKPNKTLMSIDSS